MKKSLKLLLISALLISPVSFASGGYSENYANSDRYDIGKKVFREQVVCESCPHADLELITSEVEQILPDLQLDGAIGQFLSYRDRISVNLFVKHRFNL